MTVWTWQTWADVLVDFGREVYVPWQLTEGKVLYRDIAYFNGPLSPYLNSIWFRLFGTSILTLAICNLAILAALVCLCVRHPDAGGEPARRYCRLFAAAGGFLLRAASPYRELQFRLPLCPRDDARHRTLGYRHLLPGRLSQAKAGSSHRRRRARAGSYLPDQAGSIRRRGSFES